MPVIETINNIIGLTANSDNHAVNLLTTLPMLRRVRDFMDSVETFNQGITGLVGAQGQGGNFSLDLRKGLRNLVIVADRVLMLLDQDVLRIPQCVTSKPVGLQIVAPPTFNLIT